MTKTKPASSPGRVFVVSGPTAVGKGTVVQRLKSRFPDLYVSVSATTREPREGEIDGIHYYFVSKQQFRDLVDSGGLLEWAVVHKTSFYGTPRKPVEDAVNAGKVVILEIDLQGARQVRLSMPEAKQLFLKPPSWEELVTRLEGRGTETLEEQRRRLETAKLELEAEKEFDYVVVNDQLDHTVDTLVGLFGLE